ncbi:MAG: PAS domain-containing protein [Verrucomicrobiales bacterium]|nr:PAS domain-containing protein [Verrucomicrobiales bacterium]
MSHHSPTTSHCLDSEHLPIPAPEPAGWKSSLLKAFGESPEMRWGSQLIRIHRDMIVVCDSNLEIQYHNQSFRQNLGFSRGTFVGYSLLDFFPDKDREAAANAFDYLQKGPKRGFLVESAFLSTGMALPFEAAVTRSLRNNGSYYFYLIARPQGQLEKRNQPQVEEPAVSVDSPNATSDLMANLPIAVWCADQNHRITSLSGKLWDQLGVDCQLATGAELGLEACVSTPEVLARVPREIRTSPSPVKVAVDFQGGHYEAVVEPLFSDHGVFVGTIGYLRPAEVPAEQSATLVFHTTTEVSVEGDTDRVHIATAPVHQQAPAIVTTEVPLSPTRSIRNYRANIRGNGIGSRNAEEEEVALPR